MKYGTWIDNVKSLEWGLNIPQAYLFSWIYSLPSWADSCIIENDIYYFAAKEKVIKDIPLLTDKIDTVYKHYRELEKRGLIKIKKIDKRDYIQLTKKGKEWNNTERTSDYSEKNPSVLGKKSELYSEKNPTDNIIIVDTITKDNNTDIPEKKFSGVFDENLFEKAHSGETNFLETESKLEKKKKQAKKEKKPDDETYNGIKTSFLAYYLKITGTSYYFEGKDGKKIKSLENKLKFALNEKGLDSSPQSVINSFNILLEKLPDFYKSVGLSLSVIDSKYNNIVAEIKNKRVVAPQNRSILPHQNSFIEVPKQNEINYDDLTL